MLSFVPRFDNTYNQYVGRGLHFLRYYLYSKMYQLTNHWPRSIKFITTFKIEQFIYIDQK